MFGIDVHDPWRSPEPTLLPVPQTTRGFVVRVDLLHTKPPVWRRLELPGDIKLPQLHDVLQAAMGWTDSHLHKFRTSDERNAPEFLTPFDFEEGEVGVAEDGVRFDQIVATVGDRLFYDYDFGDNWQHCLRVEKVLEAAPENITCTAGKLACPPEDCGGTWGYQEIAEWVRGDYADDLRPEVFESTERGQMWLPHGWHPEAFDLAETNRMIAVECAEISAVTAELGALLTHAASSGSRTLRDLLSLPIYHSDSQAQPLVTAEDADRLTAPFRVLLDVIGESTPLTAAGYLKPVHVKQIAEESGVTEWWFGLVNREDLTAPVALLRDSARALGLVTVRKGKIFTTQAAKRCAGNPEALLTHIARRLPLGKPEYEQHSGWIALVVAGSEAPIEQWREAISEMMFEIGWRDGNDRRALPSPMSGTLDVLTLLNGYMRKGWNAAGTDPAVAAFARRVVRGD
ncbi:plasmid pRiA4b ORF-3 family protein [Leucobacter sp. HY1908]